MKFGGYEGGAGYFFDDVVLIVAGLSERGLLMDQRAVKN
jgi:hypothetical protein